ncbi:MAG: hypothetical protein VYD87_11110 [Pseudomonadota bacterium]|nr:hypothetical protein [Pseudomonadota bacterium]
MAMTDAKRAAILAAYILTGNKAEAARKLEGLLDAKATTIRLSLSGVDEEAASSLLRDLASAGTAPSRDAEPAELAALAAARQSEARAKRDLRAATLALASALDLRTEVFGLTREPLRPRPIRPGQGGGAELAWFAPFFDYHLGKGIDAASVNGLQTYDLAVARARIRRHFEHIRRLISDHGSPVRRIVLGLGGDNCNGELRHDDTATNVVPPVQQAREFAEAVVEGVRYLLDAFPEVEIDVVSVVGNHGRMTDAPPSANIEENFDAISALFVEAHLRGEPRASVRGTPTPDVLLDLYGTGFLISHGDRLGSNGGDGQIGAIGPVQRGFLKIKKANFESRIVDPTILPIHWIAVGHYHSHFMTDDGFCSGAGCGPDPYSTFKLRVPPRPPRQWLFGVHSRRGLVEHKTIFPGHPDEGPICAERNLAAIPAFGGEAT